MFKLGPLVFTLIAICACERQQEAPVSLAGSSKLPSISELSRETILIELTQPVENQRSYDNLHVTLRPSDVVEVKRLRSELWPSESKPKILSQRTFKIAQSHAEQARNVLAVLHPQRLDKPDAPVVLPEGCPAIADGSSDALVLFSGSDGRFGIFELPTGCKVLPALRAKEAVAQALRLLQD
ncbi:hypothetical protein [Sphingomonas flavescens]|jgi:hypothetical protein|uniref:hypothetical protein n=1 Tax=Sphingomonas flavescens TaxID=3132797 RepID=UPI0028046105|nr:hypothetical protein [Sphingomonas limnosediminicola]